MSRKRLVAPGHDQFVEAMIFDTPSLIFQMDRIASGRSEASSLLRIRTRTLVVAKKAA